MNELMQLLDRFFIASICQQHSSQATARAKVFRLVRAEMEYMPFHPICQRTTIHLLNK